MSWPSTIALLAAFSCAAGCGPGVFSAAPPQVELRVAAAANLASIFDALAAAEYKKDGIRMLASFGSTAQLTKQIESGAPFDLFLAADSQHPQQLASSVLSGQPRAYARGRLVIWAPKQPDIRSLVDLARPDVKVIAIANPELAPYGHAAVEALNNAHLWERVKPKLVYAQNISAAQTFADTGNADVALTAFSLVAAKHPDAPLVPETLHTPIIQSLCILSRTSQAKAADRAVEFLLGPEARKIFQANGYSAP